MKNVIFASAAALAVSAAPALAQDDGAAQSQLTPAPAEQGAAQPVSYTHLTLPTICSV